MMGCRSDRALIPLRKVDVDYASPFKTKFGNQMTELVFISVNNSF